MTFPGGAVFATLEELVAWARPRCRQRHSGAILLNVTMPLLQCLPNANTAAMQLHLDEIGRAVAKGAHPVGCGRRNHFRQTW